MRRRTHGSSPLARGLRSVDGGDTWEERIIPARAGFTPTTRRSSGSATDHPRSRGVYRSAGPPRPCRPGSSPLARGLRGLPAGGPHRARIIPARAGFTRGRGRLGAHRRDHPRSRGVYTVMRRRWRRSRGSSPLARGLLVGGVGAVQDAGIIPARAGFTCIAGRELPPHGDHPRSRGVYQPGRPMTVVTASPSLASCREGT